MLHTAIQKFAHIRTERAIALLLWVWLFAALGVYGYSIVNSIVNVMLRQEMMVSIQNAEAKVSALEADYLARTEKISDKNIAAAGLVKISKVSYVTLTDDDRLSRLP
jgi:hypothetical protein